MLPQSTIRMIKIMHPFTSSDVPQEIPNRKTELTFTSN